MQLWGSSRRLKRLAMVLGILVALVLIANGFMAWRTARQLQGRIAAIRATGDPASISDLAPMPIPAEENAAAILEKLAPQLDEFAKAHGQFLQNDPVGLDYERRNKSGERPGPQQIDAIRAILSRYPDVDSGLAAAAACDKYASLANYSLDHQQFLDTILKDRIARIRTAARFLVWRNEVLVADGQHEQAVEQGIDLLRLARLHDAEPLLVNYLVGVAVRGIACNMLYDALNAGPVPTELHAAVEKELASHDTSQRLIHALKSDRAYSTSVAAEAGAGPAFDQGRPFYARIVDWPMKRFFLGAMDYLDMQIVLAEQAWPNANARIGRGGASRQTNLGVMADLLVPAVQASYEAEARIVAVMRSLRVFNSLRQFLEVNGRDASGLDELRLSSKSTIDPYSSESLKLKQSDEGWIVYSVMENGVDDRGDFSELSDYGVAPPKLRLTK